MKDMDVGKRKIRETTGMIIMKMRQSDMAHVITLIAQRFDLSNGRLSIVSFRTTKKEHNLCEEIWFFKIYAPYPRIHKQ
jgi:hypothetical protein